MLRHVLFTSIPMQVSTSLVAKQPIAPVSTCCRKCRRDKSSCPCRGKLCATTCPFWRMRKIHLYLSWLSRFILWDVKSARHSEWCHQRSHNHLPLTTVKTLERAAKCLDDLDGEVFALPTAVLLKSISRTIPVISAYHGPNHQPTLPFLDSVPRRNSPSVSVDNVNPYYAAAERLAKSVWKAHILIF